jgi:glycosyltransferase involved in cell wall biosynthesis
VVRSIFFYTDSRTLGGAEQAMFMLMEHLDSTRWRSTLLLDAVPATEILADRARAAGSAVHFIPPMPLGLTGAARSSGLVRLLRAERPSVFHAHLTWPLAAKFGLVAAIVARVPAVVATVQLIPEFDLDRSSKVQLRLLSRYMGRYIAVSEDIASRLVRDFAWPRRKIEVIYNAVDAGRFRNQDGSALRKRLTGGHDRPLVLTCARLDPQKGYEVLLEAATALPDVAFAFAGDGPERATLEARSASLGLADRVQFLGFRADIPRLLDACDVFALPSLYEGSSLAVLEAMAARRPVVSSDIGGTNELITHGRSGMLVRPGDAAALADVIAHLLAEPGLRAHLTQCAAERVEREFTPAAMADAVQRIYDDLCSGS